MTSPRRSPGSASRGAAAVTGQVLRVCGQSLARRMSMARDARVSFDRAPDLKRIYASGDHQPDARPPGHYPTCARHGPRISVDVDNLVDYSRTCAGSAWAAPCR